MIKFLAAKSPRMFASGIILILLFAELRQGLNAAPLTGKWDIIILNIFLLL